MNSINRPTFITEPTRDVSKLDSALCALDSASGALLRCIDSLEERLAALLEPQICGDSNKGEPMPAQTATTPAPLIAAIENQTDIIGNAEARIGFLLSRLIT